MKTRLFNSIRWCCALLLLVGSANNLLSNNLNSKLGGVNSPLQLELIVPDTLLLPYCEFGEITVRVTNTSSNPVLVDQVRLYNEGSIVFPVGLGDFDVDFGNQNPCGGGPQVSLDLRTDQVVIPANSVSDFSVTIQLTNNCGQICNVGGYSRVFATVDSEYVVPFAEKRVYQEKMCLLDGEDQPLFLSQVWNPHFYNGSHSVYYAILIRGEVVVDFFDPNQTPTTKVSLVLGKLSLTIC